MTNDYERRWLVTTKGDPEPIDADDVRSCLKVGLGETFQVTVTEVTREGSERDRYKAALVEIAHKQSGGWVEDIARAALEGREGK